MVLPFSQFMSNACLFGYTLPLEQILEAGALKRQRRLFYLHAQSVIEEDGVLLCMLCSALMMKIMIHGVGGYYTSIPPLWSS